MKKYREKEREGEGLNQEERLEYRGMLSHPLISKYRQLYKMKILYN